MIPAAIRYNNPGAMYPGKSASRFGSKSYGVIGGGHKIARFPTPVDGAAAQFDLLNRVYAGMPLGQLIKKWSGGNSSGKYANFVAGRLGIDPSTPITSQMIADPNFAVRLAQAKSQWETGGKFPLDQEGWRKAHAMVFPMTPAGAAPTGAVSPPSGTPAAAQPASASTVAGPSMANKPPQSMNPFGALASAMRDPLFLAGATMLDGSIGRGAQVLSQAQGQKDEMEMRRQQMAQQAPMQALRMKILEAQARAAGAPAGPKLMQIGNQIVAVDPATGKATPTYTAPQPQAQPKWVKLGTDAQGQEIYGQMDSAGNVTPYRVPGITPGQLPGYAGMSRQGPNSIPPPPPGVNAQEYFKQASKELAKAGIASRQNWPSVNAKIDNALGVIDGVLDSPAFERSTSVIQGQLPSITADARNFDEKVEQLRGQAFVQAFQDIKGGGAITEAEGKAATQALARLRRQTVGSKNFKEALDEFRRELVKLRQIAAEKAGVSLDEQPAAATAGAPQQAPKRRRFNPDTGRIE